jgi:hypothetical protein
MRGNSARFKPPPSSGRENFNAEMSWWVVEFERQSHQRDVTIPCLMLDFVVVRGNDAAFCSLSYESIEDGYWRIAICIRVTWRISVKRLLKKGALSFLDALSQDRRHRAVVAPPQRRDEFVERRKRVHDIYGTGAHQMSGPRAEFLDSIGLTQEDHSERKEMEGILELYMSALNMNWAKWRGSRVAIHSFFQSEPWLRL